MSRVAVKHASDQKPSSSTKVQNGPPKLNASLQQSSPAAAAKPKRLGSKNAVSQMMEVREYDQESYANDLHECRLCSGKYTLSELYQHYETEHHVCICVYCETNFESRLQLASHLETGHNISTQKYRNVKEFCDNNGKESDLMCIHCKKVLTPESLLTEAVKHDCGTQYHRCRHCGFPWTANKIVEHEESCKVEKRVVRTISNVPVNAEVAPLRARDGMCRRCSKVISPARMAQHMRECTGTPSPATNQKQPMSRIQLRAMEERKKIVRCSRCNCRIHSDLLQEHQQECTGVILATLPEPDTESKSEEIVPLDPLLVEQDPVKRVNMLISALAEYINVEKTKHQQYTGDETPPVTVTLPADFREKPTNSLLQQLVLKSSEKCLYCRQAILIRVDKRQLVLHLFINHRFKIQIPSQDISSVSVTPVEPDETEPKTEAVAAVVQDLVAKSELLTASSTESQQLDAPAAVSDQNQLASTQNQTDSTTTTQETDQTTTTQPTTPTPGHSNENRELALITNPLSPVVPTQIVSWDEFEQLMLQQIFHSSDVLFCFDRGDVVFGRMPCDCLLCGQRIGSQLKLFAHWRVAHKGVAMRCAMCTGRFLFSGSLFSHHCFGTPQLFEDVRQAAIQEVTKAEDSGQSTQAYADGESSNSTMVLRYQCEFCGIQLPGFFNYMVHMRKVHNTCELCLETVESQKLLERHHRRHKLQHFCWKCGIPYLAKPNYMTHLFWKHGAESKLCYTCLEKKWPFIYHFCLPPTLFTCETCKIQFTKPISLLVHKRLHSNEKLRNCPSCLERFVSKKLLNKHIEANHKGTKAILDGSAEASECTLQLKLTRLEDQTPAQLVQTSGPSVEDIKEEKPDLALDQIKNEEQDASANQALVTQEHSIKSEEDAEESKALTTTPDENQRSTPEPEPVVYPTANIQPDTAEPASAGAGVTESKEPAGELLESLPKRKSKNKSNYSVSSLHGPNLSEEESDGDAADDGENESSRTQTPELNEPGHIKLPTPPEGSNPTSPLSTEVAKPETLAATTPVLPVVDEPKPQIDQISDIQPPEFKGQPEGRSQSDYLPMTVSTLDSSAISTDLSTLGSGFVFADTSVSTKTAETLDDSDNNLDDSQIDDFRAMSPLLPPLDSDFPDIPTLEDGISTQQHILNCLSLDHDYVLPAPKELNERQACSTPTPAHYDDDSHHPPLKRLKIAKLPQKKKDKRMKRRRHSSSSSSSSSSSCSSCGSNCSCSSSSSSDDESSPVQHTHKRPRGRPPKLNKEVKVTNRIKQSPAKKPKVVKDPTIPKRPVGRPPKYPKDGTRPPPTPKPKTTARQNADQRRDEMLKHFKNKEDAFIPESDLDTELSDSEEKFDKQQLEEVIGKVPEAFDEVWKQSNEKFLLQVVKGVKDLEELRPRPKPRVPKQNANMFRAPVPPLRPARPQVSNNSYKVVTKPEPNGKEPRLKLRNVPLKKLYLVNTSARNGGVPASSSVVSIRPPVLKSGFSRMSALNIQQTSRLQMQGMHMQKTAVAGSSRSSMGTRQIQNNGRQALNKIHPNNVNSAAVAGNHGIRRPVVREMSSFDASNPIPSTMTIHHSTTITPIPQPQEIEPPRDMQANANTEVALDNAVTSSTSITTVAAPVPESVAVAENNGEGEQVQTAKNLYCYCQSDEGDSNMIACDGAKCKHEWFHFRCVGVIVAPKGKWYCPDCRPVGKGKKQSVSRGSLENRPKQLARNGIETTTIKGAGMIGAGAELSAGDNNVDIIESEKNLSADAANFSSPLLDSSKPIS